MSERRSSRPPPPTPVQPGDLLAGKYRVERVIAAGGMGVVVAARHEQLEEPVAIKFLLPDALGNRETVERFEREARAAVRIKSEHVARVLDVGAMASGAPYIVMEYLEGEDLAARLHRAGRRPHEEAVEVILQACEAIVEAHSLGIIHRDLKPGNLFLARRADGSLCVKVLDFGVSKVDARFSRANAALTSATAVLGSPLYMSPEQLRSSRDADARSDIWSLGAILFEMLAGTSAFDAPTIPEMCDRIDAARPPSLRELRADVPAELERAVGRCLAKDPTSRFQTVVELARAIAPFASQRAQLSADRVAAVAQRAGGSPFAAAAPRRISPGAITLDATDSEVLRDGMTGAAWGQTILRRRPRGPLAWAAIAAAGAALAGGIYAMASGGSQPSAASSAQLGEAPPSVLAESPSRAATPTRTPAPGASTEAPAPSAEEEAAEGGAEDAAAARPPVAGPLGAVPPRRGRGPLVRPAGSASAAPPSVDHLFDEPK